MNSPVYVQTLPLVDQWAYNEFLDRQHQMLKASGANDWLLNHSMLHTLAAMGRMKNTVRLPRGK